MQKKLVALAIQHLPSTGPFSHNATWYEGVISMAVPVMVHSPWNQTTIQHIFMDGSIRIWRSGNAASKDS